MGLCVVGIAEKLGTGTRFETRDSFSTISRERHGSDRIASRSVLSYRARHPTDRFKTTGLYS